MTTPSPGRGWRWLRVGEAIMHHDQVFNGREWVNTGCPQGTKVTHPHTYRRRVKKGKR